MEHLKPTQAWEIIQAQPNTLLIDSEQLEAGDALDDKFHEMGADEIERFRREIVERTGDARAGDNLADQVLRMAGRKDRAIILICRSGKRSVDAGLELEKHGFTDVSNVLEGFEGELDRDHHRGNLGGWRKHGLPWRQV